MRNKLFKIEAVKNVICQDRETKSTESVLKKHLEKFIKSWKISSQNIPFIHLEEVFSAYFYHKLRRHVMITLKA